MSLLSPASIAVIGASTQPGKVGHDIFKNLAGDPERSRGATQGFKGALYPINPKPGEIAGYKTIASLSDIGKPVDLAVIVTPAPTVAPLIEECAALKIRHIVVVTAGFGETHTPEGKAMEEQIRSIARRNDIRLVGPNCLGILRPSIGLNASFAKEMPPRGNIALISQSGATAVGLMDGAADFGLGFSAVFSIGNKTVLDECDFVEICAKDEETRVIGLYLESIRDGRRFLRIARDITNGNAAFDGRGKPIVLLKAGVSEHGGKAASSHTGALAGSDAGVEALCAQAGIRRAHSTEEFLDLLHVLSSQPPLATPRIAIITNAGGPGILATDAAEAAELQLPSLEEKTLTMLKAALPASASTGNPIDVIGDAGLDRYAAALKACAEDPNIDGLVALLTPQVMTPCEDIANAIVTMHKKAPMIPVTTSFVGGASVEKARRILRAAFIPTFDTPERAVRAMAALLPSPNGRGRANRRASEGERVKESKILEGRHGLLDEKTTRELFTAYDLPLPHQAIAKSEEGAVKIAKDIGYPVIAKIQSADILHKTDIGGIRGNIPSEKELRDAYNDILQNAKAHMPKARIDGVLIQEFIKAGDEFIVGAVQDPSFGTLVMAGLGGIYTELFRDTSFRMAPVSEEEAYGMLQHLSSWKMLLGLRGKPQADIPALAKIIANVSRLVTENPRIKELDLNPVLVSGTNVVVADAKVVVG
jgi:acetyltransferase